MPPYPILHCTCWIVSICNTVYGDMVFLALQENTSESTSALKRDTIITHTEDCFTEKCFNVVMFLTSMINCCHLVSRLASNSFDSREICLILWQKELGTLINLGWDTLIHFYQRNLTDQVGIIMSQKKISNDLVKCGIVIVGVMHCYSI